MGHWFTSGNFSIRPNEPHIIVNVMKEAESLLMKVVILEEIGSLNFGSKKVDWQTVKLYANTFSISIEFSCRSRPN